ncbi:beta-1,3-glucanase family protein [Kineosporia sp. NBRC 101731]|uniref:beta-1,3-glucanase family protein n=1 Tax=Kineosporia sp. NBRC 101731 TaxID=3032199 RepID=UPI0024A2EED6|nr:beta-1,3-glucanase family protein [Kineosporia sp. NBRC 101731]GLY26974.1 glycosyl hydrolase [Kineosporia sp. NBRC 101731]
MPNLTRRNLIRGAIGGGILGAVGLTAVPQLVHAANGLPLKVVNNTGKSSDQIWVHVVGTHLSTGKMGHITADGNFAEIALSDNAANGYTNYGIRLSQLNTLPLAALSGRVYISIGEQLKFRVVGTGSGIGLQYPAGWVSSDPSYNIVHDFMEFTNNDSGMYCNTTMVDMFGLPMYITLGGSKTQSIAQYKDGARAKIFEALRRQNGFEKLVQGDLRVIAPGHGIDAGLFSSTYLDGNINARWSQYSSQTMTMTANNQQYTGKIEGSKFVFRQNGVVKASFAKPTTKDVFFCNGALISPNDGVSGPIGAILAAGLNRGVLVQTQQPVTDPAQFYPGTTTNHYSRVLHANTVDGKAYGFAYDDVCEQASYIQDNAPKNVTLTLQPF